MKTIGVLGLGSIGLRHAKNLITLGHKVIGYDPDGARVSMLIDAGGQGMDPNYKVCEASEAVIIATPSQNHFTDMQETITSGKHIFVEKPIATTDPRALIELAHDKRLTIFVGNNLRFHVCVKQAKQMLGMGAIGNPIWASITVGQFTDKPTYLRDGVIFNWGAHEIDLALYLLGPAKVKNARVSPWLPHPHIPRQEVLADIALEHSGGICSTVHLDYVTRPEIRATTIVGDKGQLIIDLVNNWICLIDLDGKKTDMTLNNSWDANYLEEIKAFLDRIDGKQTLGASGEDGLRALEICLEVRKLAGL